MKLVLSRMIVGIAGALCMAVGFCDEPPPADSSRSKGTTPPTSEVRDVRKGLAARDQAKATPSVKTTTLDGKAKSAVELPSLREARRQAEVLHTAMHSTLQVVHHRYYRPDEGLPLPAAVLKEVFAELEKEQNVSLRWLAVEGQAMNSDHKPQGPFENEAVKALRSGKPEYSQAASGVFRRAGSITLTNHCLKCHVPDRKSTANRTAGLIISIPFQEP